MEQINRFNALKERRIFNKNINFDDNGNIIFPAGSIIHGTSNCDMDKIISIAESGILTGQALGIGEDGESYYCADFHKVSKDISVSEYNSCFSYVDGRCPFGTRGKFSLAFVVQPDPEIDELLSYDCYKTNTPNGKVAHAFTNDLPLSEEVASSILYGVPSSAISGIVMGDSLLKKPEIVKFLLDLFPDCYIISKTGNLIYDPKCKGFSNQEVIEIRRNSYLKDLQIEELQRQLGYKTKELERSNSKYDKLMQGIVDACDDLQAALILLASGWQGDEESTIKYVTSIRDKKANKTR